MTVQGISQNLRLYQGNQVSTSEKLKILIIKHIKIQIKGFKFFLFFFDKWLAEATLPHSSSIPDKGHLVGYYLLSI